MKKIWIIGILFFFLVTLNAKEMMGKYISYSQGDGAISYLTFQVDGKEKVFTGLSFNEELLNEHKNGFVRIKYSDDEYEILHNVYFKDGTNAIGEKTTDVKFIRHNENKDQSGNLIFEIEGKEVIFSGYDLDITLNEEDKGKMYSIDYTETSDNLKVIWDISLAIKNKVIEHVDDENTKEKELVGEYISYKELPTIGYELLLKIDGKDKAFFTFSVNEDILKKHKNEFVRIKLSDDGEGLINVYFDDGNTAMHEYDFTTGKGKDEKACDNGNTQTCYELARENAEFLEATGYYNKACEGGHAKACNELAQIYELGNRAVQKDVKSAKKFYKLACKNGYSKACSLTEKLNKRVKVNLIYDVLNKAYPRIKGLKPIDPSSNVLVADNSAHCMLIGKISFEPFRVYNVPLMETIAWGKAPLSGMTHSVLLFDGNKFFFKKAHYDNGVKYLDEYEGIIRKRYKGSIERVAGGDRTFFITPGEKDKKFILECYYTR